MITTCVCCGCRFRCDTARRRYCDECQHDPHRADRRGEDDEPWVMGEVAEHTEPGDDDLEYDPWD